MEKLLKILLSLLITVHILTVVECGFGKSFVGGLAGSVIGRALTGGNTVKHEHYYVTPPQTTIERLETLANGCYRQRVKEPDMSHVGRYIATEQMICPPAGTAVVAPAMQSVPMQVNSMPGVPVPVSIPNQIVTPGGSVTVLSTSTGRYSGAMSLVKSSSLVLIVLTCLVAFFF